MDDDIHGRTLAERLGYPPDVVADEEERIRRARHQTPASTVDAPAPWQDISPRARRAALAERLAEVADQLAGVYNASLERIQRDMPDVCAFAVVDASGAPVVAPTLAALGNVLAALATLEQAER